MDSKPIQILLGSSRHKTSVDEDNFIGVELTSYEKVMPFTEGAYTVDSYEQYFKERDNSEKHRFAFTITPFCSNVLFNVLTEPVYKEGSDDCFTVTDQEIPQEQNPFKNNYNERKIDRYQVIRDTGYSHPKINDYPLVYHCGYDIFNNHFLRKTDFSVVNKSAKDNVMFNTIEDKLRTGNGDVVNEEILQIKFGTTKLNSEPVPLHLYQYSTIKSFIESIADGLVENNGWIGFLNATTIPVNNVSVDNENKDYSINKCMNNNKAWEQIDMYPDRSLYSFVPKINKFRGRVEKNWEYMMTYPFYSFYDNDVVRYSGNGIEVPGLKCKLITELYKSLLEDENTPILFKSFVRHNLRAGEYITLSLIMKGGNERKTAVPVKILSVGTNGEDGEHYFSVRLTDILTIFSNRPSSGGNFNVSSLVRAESIEEIRFRKHENGADCKYYIRVFKKFNEKLTSSLNKLAFSQNIYSDQVAQIVFTDDVLTNYTDNLGRPLSEVFLTLVKTNNGHEEWYENGNTTGETIEYSHCFGKITSGFDFPEDGECSEYNVHRIHSVSGHVDGITPSPTPLESDVNCYSGSTDAYNAVPDGEKTLGDVFFFGDLIEFSLPRLEETVLEDVYHRFNTAQREFVENGNSTRYGKLFYDEIIHDDYDIGEKFDIEKRSLLAGRKHINVIPEGYYYKPHYGVKIRRFDTTVQQGNHIRVIFSDAVHNGTKWTIHTAKNYYFETPINYKIDNNDYTKDGSIVYAYRVDGGNVTDVVSGRCIDVSGENFTYVTIDFGTDINIANGLWRLFRYNTECPDYALSLDDGTGRYLWRDVLSYSDMTPDDELYDDTFTNGAHYHHKNIMFYLKRQDPEGIYGIGLEPDDVSILLWEGLEKKDISYADYKQEGEGTIC